MNVQTICYYERRGLLPKPHRTESNYRMYSEDVVIRVHFIKRMQPAGPGTRCIDVRRRAEDRVQDIDDKIRTLDAMRKTLNMLVDECSEEGPVVQCPILEALDEEHPTVLTKNTLQRR